MSTRFVPLLATLAAPLLACSGAIQAPGAAPADEPAPRRAHAKDAPPNWLVILLDDLGTDKVGAYGEHPKAPPTPTLDGLAGSGLLFRNAYANPVCSPSRAALLTGRYGRRTGFGAIVEIANADVELPLDEVLIPEVLDQADDDWTSVALGKWHLSAFESPTNLDHPNKQGFDHYAGALGNLFHSSTGQKASWRKYEKIVDGKPTWVEEYATTDTTNDAIAQLGTLKAPWFMYVAYNAPHTPFHVPPAKLYSGRIDNKASDIQKFDATVEALDHEIGRLLDAMSPEQRANTYVVVVGDNGTDRDAVLPPLDPDHGKASVFEGGVNVPMIVTGPGVDRGETQALVHLVDFLPTIAESAGVTPTGKTLDGISFLDVLGDASASGDREYLYVERFAPLGGGPFDLELRAIRDDRYKIVVDRKGTTTFHDLKGRNDDGPGADPRKLRGEDKTRYTRLNAELERLERTLSYEH
jgi:arylsulfatase A-like enzyme